MEADVVGVDVWWAQRADRHAGLDVVLDHVEIGRRDRLVRPDDRDRLVVAAALARLVLGDRLALPPADVPLDRTCAACGRDHGRPRLRSRGPGYPGYAEYPDYTVSHCGDLVVLALPSLPDRAALGGIGVDVERIEPGAAPPIDQLWRDTSLPLGADPWSSWVRTEAYLKATGAGITGDLHGMSLVEDGSDASHRVVGPRGVVGLVVDLPAQAGYVAALAVLPADGAEQVTAPQVVHRDGSALLRTLDPHREIIGT